MPANENILDIERRTDIYRGSTIGKALFESLKELIDSKKLTPSVANTTLEEFDRCISSILQDLPSKYEAVFQAGEVVNYRLLGEQWSVRLKNVLFSYFDQDIDDDITPVRECVLHCAKPILFSINLDQLKKQEEKEKQSMDT